MFPRGPSSLAFPAPTPSISPGDRAGGLRADPVLVLTRISPESRVEKTRSGTGGLCGPRGARRLDAPRREIPRRKGCGGMTVAEPRRLYRSERERKIAGICGGLAKYFNVDPVMVRLATIVLAVVSGILPLVIVYLAAILIVPLEPASHTETSEVQMR